MSQVPVGDWAAATREIERCGLHGVVLSAECCVNKNCDFQKIRKRFKWF